MMELLEQNKVDSNGTINSVLFPCLHREIQGVRGLHVQDIQKAFIKRYSGSKHPRIRF